MRGWECNTYESSDNCYPKRRPISPRPRNFLYNVEKHGLNVLVSLMCKIIIFYTEILTWKNWLTFFFHLWKKALKSSQCFLSRFQCRKKYFILIFSYLCQDRPQSQICFFSANFEVRQIMFFRERHIENSGHRGLATPTKNLRDDLALCICILY